MLLKYARKTLIRFRRKWLQLSSGAPKHQLRLNMFCVWRRWFWRCLIYCRNSIIYYDNYRVSEVDVWIRSKHSVFQMEEATFRLNRKVNTIVTPISALLFLPFAIQVLNGYRLLLLRLTIIDVFISKCLASAIQNSYESKESTSKPFWHIKKLSKNKASSNADLYVITARFPLYQVGTKSAKCTVEIELHLLFNSEEFSGN
mgnify:FL=1